MEKDKKNDPQSDPESMKKTSKMRAKKNMKFEKVPVGILFPPDLPKMITNQKINYR